MISSALSKLTREKSVDEMKCFPDVSRLEKMEDLVADGDIIAGDCAGETLGTSGRLTFTTAGQMARQEDSLASRSARLRLRPAGQSSRAEDLRCLSWAGDERPRRAETAHLNIQNLEKWGSR